MCSYLLWSLQQRLEVLREIYSCLIFVTNKIFIIMFLTDFYLYEFIIVLLTAFLSLLLCFWRLFSFMIVLLIPFYLNDCAFDSFLSLWLCFDSFLSLWLCFYFSFVMLVLLILFLSLWLFFDFFFFLYACAFDCFLSLR